MPSIDLGPKPRLGYSDNSLERAAERREDPAAIAALAQDARSRGYALVGEFVVLRRNGADLDPLHPLRELHSLGASTETVFLGLLDGAARFAVALEPAAAAELKGQSLTQLTDLRSIAVQGLVAPEHLAPLAEAKALLNWHTRHRFCANCGSPTQSVNAGWRRDCPVCKAQHFPRTDPVVIMLAVSGERCLLGRQGRFASGMWSCLAGFVEPGEAVEQAVRRETLEEAGILCGRVVYFASQPWPFPMSLMIGCHAKALSEDIIVDRTELEDARWFARTDVAAMLRRAHPGGLATPPPIAIAHHIIRAWVEHGEGVFGANDR
jgi:NAD+ diphosphatase